MKKIKYAGYQKPTDYLTLEEGDTRIRIISSGLMGRQHGMRTARGYTNLGLCSETADCEHCKNGSKPKRFWKWICVDIVRDEVKVLDAGSEIGNAISYIGADQVKLLGEDKGDPINYDLIITRRGKGKSSKYGVRIAEDNTEVTEDKLKEWTESKKFLISRYFINK